MWDVCVQNAAATNTERGIYVYKTQGKGREITTKISCLMKGKNISNKPKGSKKPISLETSSNKNKLFLNIALPIVVIAIIALVLLLSGPNGSTDIDNQSQTYEGSFNLVRAPFKKLYISSSLSSAIPDLFGKSSQYFQFDFNLIL